MNKLFNNKRFMGVLMFLSALALGAVIAQAQIVHVLQASIPFEFNAGNARLPAGDYIFEPTSAEGSVLELRTENGQVDVLLESERSAAATRPETSKLVFDKIGNRDFLREIWVQGQDAGYVFAKSREERNLEKKGLNSESHSINCMHDN